MTLPRSWEAGRLIEVRGLTKHYGPVLAIDDLTFEVRPGKVTGFLGPNGAGKSTTMRLILGLDAPDAGTATVAGWPYRALRRPLPVAGAMLEWPPFTPGAAPARICWPWPPPTRSPGAESTRCSRWLGWTARPGSGPEGSLWA